MRTAEEAGLLVLWDVDPPDPTHALTRKEAAYILDKAFPFEED